MTKKILTASLTVVLVAALIGGATMAWLSAKADAPEATFTAGTVNIEAGQSAIRHLGFTPGQTPVVGPEVIGNFGFIPNSGEASVSKVDLETMEEVARYYTANRADPPPIQWRTSRIAMDAGGNAWVLNVGSDGSGLQGAVVRIQADTNGLTTHNYTNRVAKTPSPLDFGTDEAVQVFPVGASEEMPRAIAIDGDGYIWVGFYGSGRLAKFQYDEAGPSLTQVDDWTSSGIGFYEMKLHPDGTLFISSRQSTSTPTRSGIVTGIYTFDPGTGAFALEPVSLPSNGPYSLLIAEDGTVYATAYSNLLYIRTTVGSWSSVVITAGSIQNRGMGFDNLGNVWIASTVGTTGGTVIYSYIVATGLPGPTYTLTGGATTPVGVGRDNDGNMWAVCRSDAMAQGWIEGFDPVTQAKVGAIQVGYRPYAYGDFVQVKPPDRPWNPGDCSEVEYWVHNIGTKDIRVRASALKSYWEFNWQWLWENRDALCFNKKYQGMSFEDFQDAVLALDDPVEVTLCEKSSNDWELVDGYFYYVGEEFNPIPYCERVYICLRVCLDGEKATNEFQAGTYRLVITFDAIQASHYAPYHGWGAILYGTPS